VDAMGALKMQDLKMQDMKLQDTKMQDNAKCKMCTARCRPGVTM